MSTPLIEITGIAKVGGPLTKRISLAPDGSLRSDGSECIMAKGTAKRVTCATLQVFASYISECRNHEAIALGALRPDLPDEVKIVTKSHLEKLNGTANDLIARTSDHILYRIGQPALALIDIDTKGMPDAVRGKIKEAGGYWAALVSVVPELEQASRVVRRSTSTGISRSDTGQALPGSNGAHIFVLVQDGGDIERFLRTLHDRCWLAGFGWFMVGAGGQLLERSIVDRMVYAPERLVFEGAPVLDPPLLQDLASRQATVTDGAPLDTVARHVPRSPSSRRRGWRSCEPRTRTGWHQIAPRPASTSSPSRRNGSSPAPAVPPARHAGRSRSNATASLLSGVVLPFDDREMQDCTVADVLANPDRFVGATLSDPLEGPAYGRCKAKIMRRAGGEVWIHSFAHGRTVYELRHDASMALLELKKLVAADVPDGFVRLVLEAGSR